MCGIHGFSGSNPQRLFRMAASAANRGPDGLAEFDDGVISLGQNLLAIMDVPENSRQPWVLPDGRGVLAFNGQIYNWAELARDLGEGMRTWCDTELLALGLAEEGEAFLERVEGMYALAFYSPRTRTVLLARDAAGVKPLYYAQEGGQLCFSSELRSLAQLLPDLRLDPVALTIYFQLGYVPGEKTLISKAMKLRPGEWRRYALQDLRQLERGRTGAAPPAPTEFKPSTLRNAIRDSVRHCALSLRPLGLYLSGGMDSAVILHEAVSLDVPLKAYSTRFVGEGMEPFNEDADLARRLADHYGVEHQDVLIDAEQFLAAVDLTFEVVDEPRYNRSTPAYLLTTQALARDGAIVTMSGDGGDEALGGYPKYNNFNELLSAGAFNAAPGKKRERIFESLQAAGRWRWACDRRYDLRDPVHRWFYMSKFRLEERGLTGGPTAPAKLSEVLAYLKDNLDGLAVGGDPLNDHLTIEQNTWLPEDALIRNDKIGMAFSMEGRFPLTTRGFRAYAMGLPSSVKIVDRKLKRCMRWGYEGVLPDWIVNRASKTGWAAPVLAWRQNDPDFHDEFSDVLSGGAAAGVGDLLDIDAIRDSQEPKLQYAAFYLSAWMKRWGISR